MIVDETRIHFLVEIGPWVGWIAAANLQAHRCYVLGLRAIS